MFASNSKHTIGANSDLMVWLGLIYELRKAVKPPAEKRTLAVGRPHLG